MATIGLRDLFRSKITKGSNGIDTYGDPVRLAKMISADLSVNPVSQSLYADDGVDQIYNEFVNGEIKLNINDLENSESAILLGQTTDADGVTYAADDDDAPYFALAFRAAKPGGLYRYIWLYKVKFTIPNEKYTTKADKITFSTPEITGTFIKRHDGFWKADYTGFPSDIIAGSWFDDVREPSGT